MDWRLLYHLLADVWCRPQTENFQLKKTKQNKTKNKNKQTNKNKERKKQKQNKKQIQIFSAIFDAAHQKGELCKYFIFVCLFVLLCL